MNVPEIFFNFMDSLSGQRSPGGCRAQPAADAFTSGRFKLSFPVLWERHFRYVVMPKPPPTNERARTHTSTGKTWIYPYVMFTFPICYTCTIFVVRKSGNKLWGKLPSLVDPLACLCCTTLRSTLPSAGSLMLSIYLPFTGPTWTIRTIN